MKMLFLDDMPQRVPLLQPGEEVFYVRDPEEFAHWLLANGTPDVISFDHDLSDIHYDKTGGYCDPLRPPSGTDCARWAVEKGFVPKTVVVHSWNEAGAKRIADCFLKENKLIPPCERLVVRPFKPGRPHLSF